MPPLKRTPEVSPLNDNEKDFEADLRNKGNEVWKLMHQLLPDRGILGPSKTNFVEYDEPGAEAAPNTKLRAWLERDRFNNDGSIRLILTPVPSAQPDHSNEGWDYQTMATINLSGELIDDRYRRLIPRQRIGLLQSVLETVQLIAEQSPPESPQQRLGRTALS
jgi:hypothetical protein